MIMMKLDVVLSADSTIPNRVWISSQDALAVVEKGFRIVQVPSNYFYLVSLPGSSYSHA
jgi:hexosaminidase